MEKNYPDMGELESALTLDDSAKRKIKSLLSIITNERKYNPATDITLNEACAVVGKKLRATENILHSLETQGILQRFTVLCDDGYKRKVWSLVDDSIPLQQILDKIEAEKEKQNNDG